jgi:quercetin dioxygenase-like cupin family protein
MSVTSLGKIQTYPNGVQILKWSHKEPPTKETVAKEMERFGYKVYDVQTCPPWFERSQHAHNEPEIRGALEGVCTFHFDGYPVTFEAGDVVMIPAGIPHEAIVHNGRPFVGVKGSLSGARSVSEHGDGKGSVEDLARK